MSTMVCSRTGAQILFLAILVEAITAVTSTAVPSKRNETTPKPKSDRDVFILNASFESQRDASTRGEFEANDSVDVNLEFGRYHRVVKRKRIHGNIRGRESKISSRSTKNEAKLKQQQSLRRTSISQAIHKKSNLDIDVEVLESILKSNTGQQKYENKQTTDVDEELLESLLKSDKEFRDKSYVYRDIPTSHPSMKVSVETTEILLTLGPTTSSISSQPTLPAPSTLENTITITPTTVNVATSMPITAPASSTSIAESETSTSAPIAKSVSASTAPPTSFGSEFSTSNTSNSPSLSVAANTVEPTAVRSMISLPAFSPTPPASQTETTLAPVSAEVLTKMPTYSPTSHTYSPTSATYYPTSRTYSPTYSTSSYSNETASDLTHISPCPDVLTKRKALLDDLTLSYDVILENERQLFCSELEYDGEGWVGFGVSETGEMVGSTAVVGLPNSDLDSNPGLYSLDGKTNSLIKLLPEEEQTILGASILQDNGATVLKFATYIDDGADGFVINVPGVTNFIYAAGESNDFGYHGMRRGSVSLVLSSTKKKKNNNKNQSKHQISL
eukprot:CCRYP_020177-RC/>CCRYP_020177-RC protein AED:0.02 eAED:0.02 QI:238/1/1/1/0.6/0.5/6/1191/559